MFSKGNQSSTDPVMSGVALVILGIIVAISFVPHPTTTIPVLVGLLSGWIEANPTFGATVGISATVNLLFVGTLLHRMSGGHRARERLKRADSRLKSPAELSPLGLLLSFAFPGLVYLLLPVLGLAKWMGGLTQLPGGLFDAVELALRVNLAFTVGVLGYGLSRLAAWAAGRLKLPVRLPAYPSYRNAIVLGALHEDSPERSPEWAVIGSKGLVGNILITGSIGSGKSAGTIFPYADQILSNFEPRPAVLAIDPKGKITGAILKIIQRLGLENQVLHMRLGGQVTFNPIYEPMALKNAAFSDIAKMIRSAAVNYMGKSFDSPFWEQSASTLVKNCLIHCAATKRYYTLSDLYTAMVRAASDEVNFIKDLEKCLERSEFDAEEKANIRFALQYFKREYQELDEKVKTGILATSTTFLNQFQEYQASEIFCPSEEKLVIRSMSDLIDQGKILLFDITNAGLARSMGTVVKLHYEQALLGRLKRGESTERPGVLIVDEYQDVVTTGYGTDFGDETFLAEGREANAISIMATQSLSSLENAIGREKPAHVLWNGFRTKILSHSGDLATIRAYQELAGKEDRPRISRGFSEHAQAAGGMEAAAPSRSSTSESVNTSEQKEYVVTAQDFARLDVFKSFAMIFDGVSTRFETLYLKPHFLKKKNTPHSRIIRDMSPAYQLAGLLAVLVIAGLFRSQPAQAFPNVCTVLKSSESRSCMDFSVGACMCGWPIPRPCAHFSYYVPESFIEVWPEPKESYFKDLPGAAFQLATAATDLLPYGAEGDEDTQSFQAHITSVPFTKIPFQTLPCGGGSIDRFCFEGMSEHLGSNWTTGSADLFQPSFLAWTLSPKACLLKGAAASVTGERGGFGGSVTPSCSYPMSWLPKYPLSRHSACTGWGVFFPRTGVYNGPASTTGALMVAARMKSLGSEVFRASSSSPDEQWQMIYPQSSSCFREGQNVAALDTVKNVRELGRITSGKLKGYLFTVWSKVSCCRDLAEVPVAYAALEVMNLACQGLGGL